MRRFCLILGLLTAASGTYFLSQFSVIERQLFAEYLQKEPFYSSPVPAPDSALWLRYDSYGKGHFGASRNGGRTHQGVDFLCALGTPITASKSGRIFFSGEEKGYGQYVQIDHPDGLKTRYAHLSARKVATGEWVQKGQLVGFAGKSGNAINPHIKCHLHFEIRDFQKALNPSQNLLDPHLKIKIK